MSFCVSDRKDVVNPQGNEVKRKSHFVVCAKEHKKFSRQKKKKSEKKIRFAIPFIIFHQTRRIVFFSNE